MTTPTTPAVAQLELLGPIFVVAGIDDALIDEVRHLVTRPPDDVSVAVIGPHNAGKTTLIAVLTADPKAREDISSDVQTRSSVPYRYSHHGANFTVWDTPGLGSEHFDHDAEARDRITKADAVVIAMSTDLVSNVGRDQLIELVKVGRKRGAVLAVVTKADREPESNREGIGQTLIAALPEIGTDIRFVAAGEVLDAWLDDEEPPANTGIPELSDALTSLALGEARRRKEATAAVRLLVLIDQIEERLAGEEPEREVALRFQRRLRKLLVRTDRRLIDARDTAIRKERLAGFRATSHIAEALDEGANREKLDVAIAEAWDGFVVDANERAQDLSEAITQVLADAGAELDRLQGGPLAESLKDYAATVSTDGFQTPTGVDVIGGETATKLLEAAHKAAKLLAHVAPLTRGKAALVAPILDISLELADMELKRRRERTTADAKDAVRAAYFDQAETIIESWQEQFDETRDETTRSALARTDAIEQELFDQLTSVREQLEIVADARRELDAFVTESIASGHAETE